MSTLGAAQPYRLNDLPQAGLSSSFLGRDSWSKRFTHIKEIPYEIGYLALDAVYFSVVTAAKVGMVFLSILPAIALVAFYASMLNRDIHGAILSLAYLSDSLFYWPRPPMGPNAVDLLTVVCLAAPSELTYRTGKVLTATIGILVPNAAEGIRKSTSLEKLHIPFEKLFEKLSFIDNLRSHGIFDNSHLEYVEIR